jgi:hypothetical protein
VITIAWTENGKRWDLNLDDMAEVIRFAAYLRRVGATDITINGNPV